MLNILIGGAAAYGLAVGGLYLLQESLLFPRAAARVPAYALPDKARRVNLVSTGGYPLFGSLISADHSGRGLILAFGGNAWNADDLAVFLARRLPDFDILVFHYRGYAPSGGKPSERALYEDALLVFDWATGHMRPRRVFAVGFSLGSAVAANLAAHRRLGGVVLVTPFDSIEAIARSRYSWAPVGLLLRHRFRCDEALRDRDVPAVVILADDDRIVPRARSEALIRVLRRPVVVATVPGSTHNGIYDHEEFDRLLERALAALEAETPIP